MNEPFRHDQSSDRWKFQTAFVGPLRSFVLALLVSVCHQGVSWGLEVTFSFADPAMSPNSTGTFSTSGTFIPNGFGIDGPNNYLISIQLNKSSGQMPDPSDVTINSSSLNGSLTYNGSSKSVSSLKWRFWYDTSMFGTNQFMEFAIHSTTDFVPSSQQAVFSFTGSFLVSSTYGVGLNDDQIGGTYGSNPSFVVVPEPGSMALGAISLAVSAATARRRKKAGQAGGRCRPESNAIRPANGNCPRAESKCAGRSR